MSTFSEQLSARDLAEREQFEVALDDLAAAVTGNRGASGAGADDPRQADTAIGAVLAPRGLLLIGLDIIGSSVTEINVTSPTCFQEIEQSFLFWQDHNSESISVKKNMNLTMAIWYSIQHRLVSTQVLDCFLASIFKFPPTTT